MGIEGIVTHGGGVSIVGVVMGEGDIRTVGGEVRSRHRGVIGVATGSRVGRSRNIQSNMRGRGAARGKVKEERRHLEKVRGEEGSLEERRRKRRRGRGKYNQIWSPEESVVKENSQFLVKEKTWEKSQPIPTLR